MAGHYTACGGWRAATRPVAGRYAACMAGRYAAWFQGRYARPTSSHSRYVRKAYHSNSGAAWGLRKTPRACLRAKKVDLA